MDWAVDPTGGKTQAIPLPKRGADVVPSKGSPPLVGVRPVLDRQEGQVRAAYGHS